MPQDKTPQISPFPLWSTDQVQNGFNRYQPLPTAALMRSRTLFGIPLRSSLTGQVVEDSTIEHYISVAVSELEHEFDLYVTPVTFYEYHDYNKHEFTWNYNYLKLNHTNVLNIDKVELTFSNDPNTPGFIEFPIEHVTVRPQEGVMQLVPAFGTAISGFLLSAFSGAQYHALRTLGMNSFPAGVRVTYTSGFPEGQIPAAMVGLIENVAAYRLLSQMGPILFPHNSVSISIDGVSQGTGNPGPAFLAQRLGDLEKIIQTQKEAVKTQYQKRFLVDYI